MADYIYFTCKILYIQIIRYDYLIPEEDKENEHPDESQTEDCHQTITSKDTTHVLRLATLLHIIQHYLKCALNREDFTPVPTEVNDGSMKQAMVLYTVLAQQKAEFVQVLL